MTTRPLPSPATPRWTALLAAASATELLLAASGAARAADRTVWKYLGGFFQNKGDGDWIEVYPDTTNKLKEVSRNDDYIELHDSTRNVSVRLHADFMDLKNNVDYKQFKRYREGHWAP
jgi:hypothetical protein